MEGLWGHGYKSFGLARVWLGSLLVGSGSLLHLGPDGVPGFGNAGRVTFSQFGSRIERAVSRAC